MLLGQPIMSVGNKIKRGDIVRLAKKPSHVADLRFSILNSKERIHYTAIGSQTGVVLREHSPDDWGTYNVAFGDTIIVAYEDYFEKVGKTLNKINN